MSSENDFKKSTNKNSENKTSGDATNSNTANSNNTNSNNSTRGGPKTPGGKARSSKNARKEGLFSRELPITEVDRPLYEKIRADLRRQLRPDTPVKEIAFENIVACLWRCVLASRVEGKRMNALLADEAAAQAEDAGPDLNTISWFGASRMALNTANRLLTRIETKMRNEVTVTDEEKQMLARAFGSNFVEVLDIWPDVKTLQQMKIDALITGQRT